MLSENGIGLTLEHEHYLYELDQAKDEGMGVIIKSIYENADIRAFIFALQQNTHPDNALEFNLYSQKMGTLLDFQEHVRPNNNEAINEMIKNISQETCESKNLNEKYRQIMESVNGYVNELLNPSGNVQKLRTAKNEYSNGDQWGYIDAFFLPDHGTRKRTLWQDALPRVCQLMEAELKYTQNIPKDRLNSSRSKAMEDTYKVFLCFLSPMKKGGYNMDQFIKKIQCTREQYTLVVMEESCETLKKILEKDDFQPINANSSKELSPATIKTPYYQRNVKEESFPVQLPFSTFVPKALEHLEKVMEKYHQFMRDIQFDGSDLEKDLKQFAKGLMESWTKTLNAFIDEKPSKPQLEQLLINLGFVEEACKNTGGLLTTLDLKIKNICFPFYHFGKIFRVVKHRINSQIKYGSNVSLLDMTPEIIEAIVKRVSWIDVIALRQVSFGIRSTIDKVPLVYESAIIDRNHWKGILQIDGVRQLYGQDFKPDTKRSLLTSINKNAGQAFVQLNRLMQHPRCSIKILDIANFRINHKMGFEKEEFSKLNEAMEDKQKFFNYFDQKVKEKMAKKEWTPLRVQCLKVHNQNGFHRLVLPILQHGNLEKLCLWGYAARSDPFKQYSTLLDGIKRCELHETCYKYSKRFRMVPDLYVKCYWFGTRYEVETEESFPFTPQSKQLFVEWEAPERDDDDDGEYDYQNKGNSVRITIAKNTAMFEVLHSNNQ